MYEAQTYILGAYRVMRTFETLNEAKTYLTKFNLKRRARIVRILDRATVG